MKSRLNGNHDTYGGFNWIVLNDTGVVLAVFFITPSLHVKEVTPYTKKYQVLIYQL